MSLRFIKEGVYISLDDIAELIGIGERRISSLIQSKIFPPVDKVVGLDPAKCVKAYIAYKVNTEIARYSKKPLSDNLADLEIEEKQNKIALQIADLKAKNLKLAVAQGKLVPIEVMEELLAQSATSFRQAADSLLPRLKMVYPDMPQSIIDEIDQITIMMLNDIADQEPDLSRFTDDALQSLYEGEGDMQETEQSDRDTVG